MTESKSPPAADRTWVPAVGEMCEGANCASGKPLRGKFQRFSQASQAGGCKETDGRPTAILITEGTYIHVTRESLRPASRASLPEAPGFKVGDYVEGVSRSTGLTFRGRLLGFVKDEAQIEDPNSPHPWYVATASLRQATHPPAPERPFCDDCGTRLTQREDGLVCADCEERASAEPSRPAEAKPGGSYRITGIDVAMGPDQSVEIIRFPGGKKYQTAQGATDEANGGRRSERIAALTASPDPLDRLAAARAKRSAHVEAHRKDLDRPSAHPRTWPEGAHEDVGELAVTHGSRGR